MVLSISACGSLVEALDAGPLRAAAPVHRLDPRASRERSFFGDGVAAHVSTAEPVSRGAVRRRRAPPRRRCRGCKLHEGLTYACVEGPRFGTRAESFLLRQFGAHLVGMTNVPEVFLAREAQLAYATLAIATDYDCWRDDPAEHAQMHAILARYAACVEQARALIGAFDGRADARARAGDPPGAGRRGDDARASARRQRSATGWPCCAPDQVPSPLRRACSQSGSSQRSQVQARAAGSALRAWPGARTGRVPRRRRARAAAAPPRPAQIAAAPARHRPPAPRAGRAPISSSRSSVVDRLAHMRAVALQAVGHPGQVQRRQQRQRHRALLGQRLRRPASGRRTACGCRPRSSAPWCRRPRSRGVRAAASMRACCSAAIAACSSGRGVRPSRSHQLAQPLGHRPRRSPVASARRLARACGSVDLPVLSAPTMAILSALVIGVLAAAPGAPADTRQHREQAYRSTVSHSPLTANSADADDVDEHPDRPVLDQLAPQQHLRRRRCRRWAGRRARERRCRWHGAARAPASATARRRPPAAVQRPRADSRCTRSAVPSSPVPAQPLPPAPERDDDEERTAARPRRTAGCCANSSA